MSETATEAAGVTDTPAAAKTAAPATEAKAEAVLGVDKGATPEAKTPEAKTPEAKPEGEAKSGAPESYAEFKIPEGATMHPEAVAQFNAAAKEMNLTQDQAQKFIDLEFARESVRQAELTKAIESAKDQWLVAAKSDKEIGGDKFKEHMGIAERALDEFGTPELRNLLKETGMNRQTELLRFIYRVGVAMSEDEFVKGDNPPGEQKTLAQRIYST
jgi:hypothetical protein